MVKPGQAQKNIFKQIFEDGWADFKGKYPRYQAVDEVVQKMLGCGDPANGQAVYLCPECLEQHEAAFCLQCMCSPAIRSRKGMYLPS
jgi:hypothetical protein